MLDEILRLIAQIAETNADLLTADTALFETGLLDSFATVELIVAIDSDLGIPVSLTEIDRETWSTPRQIAAYLEARAHT